MASMINFILLLALVAVCLLPQDGMGAGIKCLRCGDAKCSQEKQKPDSCPKEIFCRRRLSVFKKGKKLKQLGCILEEVVLKEKYRIGCGPFGKENEHFEKGRECFCNTSNCNESFEKAGFQVTELDPDPDSYPGSFVDESFFQSKSSHRAWSSSVLIVCVVSISFASSFIGKP